MPRLAIALTLVCSLLAAGWFALPTASAQPGVCVSLAKGEHEFTAPARDREGVVYFRVIVGAGGSVTEFIEPGGQSIPPVTMLDLFTGDDAYPLPDGVAIVDCPWNPDGDSSDSMAADQDEADEPAAPFSEPGYCISLDAGSHTEMISAGGRSYDVTVNVGDDQQIIDVVILERSYTAAEGLGLLSGFGASLPDHWQVSPCAASYPTTGTGGLADSGSITTTFIIGLSVLAVVALLSTLLGVRRLGRDHV